MFRALRCGDGFDCCPYDLFIDAHTLPGRTQSVYRGRPRRRGDAFQAVCTERGAKVKGKKVKGQKLTLPRRSRYRGQLMPVSTTAFSCCESVAAVASVRAFAFSLAFIPREARGVG